MKVAHTFRCIYLIYLQAIHSFSDSNCPDKLHIWRPNDNDIVTVPFSIRSTLMVDATELQTLLDQQLQICLIIDGKAFKCYPFPNSDISIDKIDFGSHILRLYIVKHPQTLAYIEPKLSLACSQFVSIRRVTAPELLYRAMHRFLISENPNDQLSVTFDRQILSLYNRFYQSLKDWAVGIPHIRKPLYESYDSLHETADSDSVLLVIGVKTSVLNGFAYRQAIRETWAHGDVLPKQVKVVFLGCSPSDTEADVHDAVQAEKDYYRDMLTCELQCTDTYQNLVQKVASFVKYATSAWNFRYLMIVDDDIYLRVDRLANWLSTLQYPFQRRLLFGQDWSVQYNRSISPQRHPQHKNYMSEELYPLTYLPPFPNGPHYGMSRDCAEYIAENSDYLQAFAANDDVSVAIWLMALQIYTVHVPQFLNLRDFTCHGERIISFADLSIVGIRTIHRNIQNNSPFCHDFVHATWSKPVASDMLANLNHYDHTVDILPSGSINVTIWFSSLELDISTHVSYLPASESFDDVCHRICSREDMSSPCIIAICERLRRQMLSSLRESSGSYHMHTALWRGNLLAWPKLIKPPILAEIRPAVNGYQRILQGLLVKLYPGREILIRPSANFADSDFVMLNQSSFCAETKENQSSKAFFIVIRTSDPPKCNLTKLSRTAILSSNDITDHIYIPSDILSFAQRLESDPNELLRSAETQSNLYNPVQKKVCAFSGDIESVKEEYLYHALKNILRDISAEDQIERLPPSQGPVFSSKYYTKGSIAFDNQVQSFSKYKFIIVNSNTTYASEQLASVFLANSVPVLLNPNIPSMYNPDAVLACGTSAALYDCAVAIAKMTLNETQYLSLLQQPPIRNTTQFNQFFSWHPLVHHTHLVDRLSS